MEKSKICRYFQNGRCRKDDCPFVHRKQLKPNCRFWKAGHCKFGDQCQFYHQTKKLQDDENQKKDKKIEKNQKLEERKYEEKKQQPQKVQTDVDQQKRQAINRLLGLQQTNHKNEQEPKLNVNFNKKIIVNFVDLSKTPEGKDNISRVAVQIFKEKPYLQYIKTLIDDQQKDKAQVIRRYQYSFKQKNQDKSQYSLKLSPFAHNRQMKLNFPIEQKNLELQIIQKSDHKSIEIRNQSIPNHFREGLNVKIKCQLETKSIYETLKYIQNNFEKICQQVDFLLENRQTSKPEVDQKIQVQQKQRKQGSQSDGDEQTQEVKKQKQIKPEIQLTTTVGVQKIDMNCEILIVQDILLHLLCDCTNPITYVLRAKKRRGLTLKARIRCPKCRQVITLYMTRLMLGKSGQDVVLGKIGAMGAKFDDIGGASWKIICPCENIIYTQQLTLSGVRKQINCYTCFKQYSIQYYGIYKQNLYMGQIANKLAYKFDKGKQINFKLDTELPNRGTCKHSKFSYRFFRYPCCGRAFPCEKCHQQKTDPHKMADRAQVMICGFCSCEQPVNSICKRCKKQLVKGSDKAGHWQGGAGCRDKTLLSKNDAKKYTGMSKTIPNKKA